MIKVEGDFSTTKNESAHAIELENSGIADQVEIKVNPTYQLNQEELREIVLLPVSDGYGREVVFFGTEYATRGREIGDAQEPVAIRDQNEYETVGVVSVKGAGLREPGNTSDHTYAGSAGILGVDEATLDSGFGNLLRQEGGNIGDTIGFIRIPPDVFLQFHDSHGSKDYADVLRSNGVEERDIIPAIIRLTDPERLDQVFSNLTSTQISAYWMLAELELNGAEKYADRYDLPPEYIDHLKKIGTGEFTQEDAKDHSKLLLWMIIRNYVICKRLGLEAEFSTTQIGNLGKLHDFPAAVDRVVSHNPDDQTETEEDTIPGSTSSLTTLIAETIVVKGEFLQLDDVVEVITDVENTLGEDLTPIKEKSREKVPSFEEKYSTPLVVSL
jgi:hypothetical protein